MGRGDSMALIERGLGLVDMFHHAVQILHPWLDRQNILLPYRNQRPSGHLLLTQWVRRNMTDFIIPPATSARMPARPLHWGRYWAVGSGNNDRLLGNLGKVLIRYCEETGSDFFDNRNQHDKYPSGNSKVHSNLLLT